MGGRIAVLEKENKDLKYVAETIAQICKKCGLI